MLMTASQIIFIKLPIDDPSKITCIVAGCGRIVSWGKTGMERGKLSTWGMKSHLQKCHREVWASLQEEEKLLALASQQMKVDTRKTETERGTLKIYNLRTSKEREEFLSRVRHLVI